MAGWEIEAVMLQRLADAERGGATHVSGLLLGKGLGWPIVRTEAALEGLERRELVGWVKGDQAGGRRGPIRRCYFLAYNALDDDRLYDALLPDAPSGPTKLRQIVEALRVAHHDHAADDWIEGPTLAELLEIGRPSWPRPKVQLIRGLHQLTGAVRLVEARPAGHPGSWLSDDYRLRGLGFGVAG